MHADATPKIAGGLPWVKQYFPVFIRSLILGYVALLPFTPLRLVERNGFLVLLASLALWCVFNRKLFFTRTPYDTLLLAFVLWIGVTLPFAVSPEYSLKEYGKLLQQVVMFYAVLYFLAEYRFRRILFYLIGSVAVVTAAYGLTQFSLTNGQAVKSFFTSEVWLTTFLVMVFPFAFAVAFGSGPREVKGIAVFACCLFVACLLSTQSRAGLIAFLVELGVMAWLLRSVTARMIAAGVTRLLIGAIIIALKVDFGKETDAMRDA